MAGMPLPYTHGFPQAGLCRKLVHSVHGTRVLVQMLVRDLPNRLYIVLYKYIPCNRITIPPFFTLLSDVPGAMPCASYSKGVSVGKKAYREKKLL